MLLLHLHEAPISAPTLIRSVHFDDRAGRIWPSRNMRQAILGDHLMQTRRRGSSCSFADILHARDLGHAKVVVQQGLPRRKPDLATGTRRRAARWASGLPTGDAGAPGLRSGVAACRMCAETVLDRDRNANGQSLYRGRLVWMTMTSAPPTAYLGAQTKPAYSGCFRAAGHGLWQATLRRS